MERDFMGLNSRDSSATVKEEVVEECNDSGFVPFSKASAVQWSLSNKGPAPHFMSFNASPEEKTIKAGLSTEAQKVHNGPRVTPFPIANQAISVSMSSNPFFKTHFGGGAQNSTGFTMKQQQLVGRTPVLRPHAIHPPSITSVGGTTEPWFNSKSSGSSPQLTIFYNGTVNVFDNISPEKAQAIISLAGNESTKFPQPRAQTQTPVPKQTDGDHVHFSPQLGNSTPNSGLSSPISVSSYPISKPAKDSTSNDEIRPIRPIAVLGNPSSKVDHQKIVHMVPSAVPQARKASLARFLEKRKERAMSSAPYSLSKVFPECAASGSNGN